MFQPFAPLCGNFVFQIGGFYANQGRTQDIGIHDLIGNRFTVTHHHDQNVLVGVGYFIPGLKSTNVKLLYGINAFYLAKTSVRGRVIQEEEFNNLAYRYTLTNYPIYFEAKALINPNIDWFDVSIDAGMGPNIIQA